MKSTDIHFITVATSNKRKAEDTAPILLPNQKVAKLKESAGGGGGGPAAPAKKRKPKREIPMEGSPILEVPQNLALCAALLSSCPALSILPACWL